MKLRNFLALGLISLLAAACNPFGTNSTYGIIKTANGGSDWQFANQLNTAKGTLGGTSVSKIVYDPQKSDHLFAGTFDSGMFMSEDAGNTWQQILSRFSVYDLAVDPNSSDIIYAAGSYTDHGRVLATRDGGKSWVEIFNEASTQNPVRAIALNPDNNQEIVIGLASGNLIKSRDAGVNWQLLQKYSDRINRLDWQGGALYVVVRSSGLYRSFDSGASFSSISKGLSIPEFNSNNNSGLLLSPAGVANFNHVAVSRSNPDTIYLTTSSGLFQSFNAGNSWNFVPLPVHQRDLQALAITVAPSSDNVVYASVGSTIYKSSDGGRSWQAEDTHSLGLIVTIAVNPELPQQAFAGIYNQ
jgi:photosystem II stability/assembly factor-like uncharacterized protein